MALSAVLRLIGRRENQGTEPMAAPLRPPGEVLDDYLAGDGLQRLNLYMQHRGLRWAFDAMERGETVEIGPCPDQARPRLKLVADKQR